LTKKGYAEIGKKIAALGRPTFFVLEGGYNGEDIGNDVDRLLKGLEISVR
jgi:acetoin utilization deacetylase AcuC-like enzyme